mmetsp:Transcript_14386/g.17260  ORF Transcript_14386/g.17260 Transcript_14386/m.17260 type:complete len:215 (-) Transcript_14386:209-853(-)|eukprot:jgi/Bigna1/46192/estExt_Genewise1.C_30013
MTTKQSTSNIKIGVLALQGAFEEHVTMMTKLGVDTCEIRNPEELEGLHGIIIPGGESSTISLVAEEWKLVDPLKKWVTEGRPVFGTCAGMIFVSKDAKNQKKHGQTLLGKLDIVVDRNHFGRQKFSFEGKVNTELDDKEHSGIFIRAPGILSVGKDVKILGTIEHGDKKDMAVAVQQGSILATCFHPELTEDELWHTYFLKIVKDSKISKPFTA